MKRKCVKLMKSVLAAALAAAVVLTPDMASLAVNAEEAQTAEAADAGTGYDDLCRLECQKLYGKL